MACGMCPLWPLASLTGGLWAAGLWPISCGLLAYGLWPAAHVTRRLSCGACYGLWPMAYGLRQIRWQVARLERELAERLDAVRMAQQQLAAVNGDPFALACHYSTS